MSIVRFKVFSIIIITAFNLGCKGIRKKPSVIKPSRFHTDQLAPYSIHKDSILTAGLLNHFFTENGVFFEVGFRNISGEPLFINRNPFVLATKSSLKNQRIFNWIDEDADAYRVLIHDSSFVEGFYMGKTHLFNSDSTLYLVFRTYNGLFNRSYDNVYPIQSGIILDSIVPLN